MEEHIAQFRIVCCALLLLVGSSRSSVPQSGLASTAHCCTIGRTRSRMVEEEFRGSVYTRSKLEEAD